MHADHPNLSSAINDNIRESELQGGVWLEMPEESAKQAHAEALEKGNVLAEGRALLIQTKNTLYRLEKRNDGFFISGSQRFCPTPVKATIHGSTWGGSMLKMNWVGRGMRLEFSTETDRGILTTEVREITEVAI